MAEPAEPWVSGDRPILILATGQRCGSTWLQRILSTHPELFIWGEHDGQLEPILAAADAFAAWCNDQGAVSTEEYRTAGTTSFMSNISPSEPVLREQVVQFIRGLYRRRPDGSVPTEPFRWGIKEVRYGAEFVRRFIRYFPATRAVYLTRDPLAVLRSLDWWERTSGGRWTREKTRLAMARWRDINVSFQAAADLSGTVLPIRYEDLKGGPEENLDRIFDFLGVDRKELDLSAADRIVHAPGLAGRMRRKLREPAEVAEEYRDLLAEPALAEVAGRLGYRGLP